MHHRTRLPLPTLVLVGLVVTGCRTHGSARSVDVGAEAGACVLHEVSRTVISPGGDTALYVEPNALESRADGFFAAGRPTFSWLFDEGGQARMLGTNTFMGVDVRRGVVRPFDPPPGVTHVGWVRTVRLGQDRWGFLIGEYDRASLAEGDLVRVVYSIREEGTWSGLEQLPVPEGGRLDFDSGGSLILGPDGLELWTALHERERGGIDVLLYRRTVDGWRASVVAEEWVDAVDLTVGPDGASWIALAGLDPARGASLASIRTAGVGVDGPTASSAWRRLHVGGPNERMISPTFVRGSTGVDLAWLRTGPEGSEAWVDLNAWEPDDDSPVLLDSAAVLLVGVSTPPGAEGAYLLSYHQSSPSSADRLNVYRRSEDGYTLVRSTPYPFQGPFAATLAADGDLLIVGPESSLDPTNPYVRSLVIRMSVSCT